MVPERMKGIGEGLEPFSVGAFWKEDSYYYVEKGLEPHKHDGGTTSSEAFAERK